MEYATRVDVRLDGAFLELRSFDGERFVAMQALTPEAGRRLAVDILRSCSRRDGAGAQVCDLDARRKS